MNIYVNGEPRQVPQDFTAARLLTELSLTGKRIAIEVNQDIVPRSSYPQLVFQDGDRVEIVQAIGGG